MLDELVNVPELARRESPELVAILQEVVAATNVPGIGVAVCDAKSFASAYVGMAVAGRDVPLSSASRFDMSCLMKFFVSAITLHRAATGKLDLSAPIERYLPELGPNASSIAIGQLLSHTSGYRGLDVTDSKVRWAYSWPQFVSHFGNTLQSFEPGSTFNYEHSEHVILGEILQRLTGQTARELVQSELFDVLAVCPGNSKADKQDAPAFVANHMSAPGTARYAPISLPPFSAFWDASLPDWSITLADVTKIGAALLEDGVVMEHLQQPVVTLPHSVASDDSVELSPRSFGMGCAQYPGGWLGHNGSMMGQTCGLRLVPSAGLSVAVGVNAWAPYARDVALQNVIALMTGSPKREPKKVHDRVAFALEALAGSFAVEDLPGEYWGSYLGKVEVSRDGDALRFDVGPPGNRRRSFAARPTARGRFSIDSSGPVSVGFFQARGSADPALLLGVHSYRKNTAAPEGGQNLGSES